MKYARAIFGNRQISEAQFVGTQQAFYAGWYSCLTTVAHIADKHTEDEASGLLSDMKQECETYHENQIKKMMGRMR